MKEFEKIENLEKYRHLDFHHIHPHYHPPHFPHQNHFDANSDDDSWTDLIEGILDFFNLLR